MVDFGPEVATGNKTISGEGKHGSSKCLRCCETNELQDNEGTHGEGETTVLSKRIVEDLSDGLGDWRVRNGCWVTHTERKDNVEQEAEDVSEEHSEGDGPRSLDFRFVDPVMNVSMSLEICNNGLLLCDVCSRIIVSHGP